MVEDIVLITRAHCPYCEQAKTLLKNENKNWDELMIGENISREEVLDMYPDLAVLPIVVINDAPIGGYNELLDYLYPPMMRE